MGDYLFWLIVVIVSSTAAVLVTIAIHHFITYLEQRKIEEKRERWEFLFFNYLEGSLSVEELKEDFEENYYLIWKFLQPYARDLKGSDFERLKKLTEAIGLKDFWLEKLKSGTSRNKFSPLPSCL